MSSCYASIMASIAYRTLELMKLAKYDLIIEIQNYKHNTVRLHSKRKSELIQILIDLEREA